MGKTFNPERYDMALCPLCKEKGKLPKNPDGFDVYRRYRGFELIKKKFDQVIFLCAVVLN